MGRSVSHLSDIATQETNVAGVLTAILAIQPEDGTMLKLRNRVSTGDAGGLPLIMDLQDSNGDPLPVDTEIILRVERPTDDDPVQVAVKEDNIASWVGLSTSEQRNEENIDQTKVELKAGTVNVRDRDVLTVDVNSSSQIDWSNSELYVLREGVEETSFEG